MDILTPINSVDSVPKKRVDFDDKTLSQMTLPEHARLLNELASFDSEELTDEEKAVADKINLSTERKVMAWAFVCKQLKESQDMLKVEEDYHKLKIKEIQKRYKTLQGRMDSRLKFISEMMKKIGKKTLEGSNFKVTFRKLPAKVEFINEEVDALAEKYADLNTIIPESVKWDLRAMKEWLKTNESDDFKMGASGEKLEVK